jgi:hypothetical protein
MARVMENLLWLPSDYRATSAAVRGNIVFLGDAPGPSQYSIQFLSFPQTSSPLASVAVDFFFIPKAEPALHPTKSSRGRMFLTYRRHNNTYIVSCPPSRPLLAFASRALPKL